MIARSMISPLIRPLHKSDKLQDCLQLMNDLKVTNLPVVEDFYYVGLISEGELLAGQADNETIEPLCIALPRPFVSYSEHLFNIVKMVTENQISVIPVLDEEGRYLGSIESNRLLDETARVLSLNEPGAIIILEVNQIDYSLSEIARIVESHNARILSCGVHTLPESTRMEVTLKINTLDLDSLLQTFIRYDYTISLYFGFSEKNESLLRERYELLMKYLEF